LPVSGAIVGFSLVVSLFGFLKHWLICCFTWFFKLGGVLVD
jgi:hypothetical protein